jgi:hypothetical protein
MAGEDHAVGGCSVQVPRGGFLALLLGPGDEITTLATF